MLYEDMIGRTASGYSTQRQDHTEESLRTLREEYVHGRPGRPVPKLSVIAHTFFDQDERDEVCKRNSGLNFGKTSHVALNIS